MIKGLGTVVYKVANLTQAKAWYTQAFAVAPYFDEPFFVGFNIGGFELGLDPDISQPVQAGDAVAYWRVDNMQETYTFLLHLGATPHDTPRDVGHGIVVASVYDPFGNIVGLLQNPQFDLSQVK